MKELLISIALVIAAALAGRLWVRLALPLARIAAWTVLGAGIGVIAIFPWDPIARMVALCCVLFAAMKSLVYLEWGAGGKRLGWGSYLIFAFLWFGMDPAAFAKRRARVEWRSHLRIGLACLVAGIIGALIVRNAGWTNILLVFVPMSIGFHYGVLRLLTAGWRLAGFPARILFRNPLASTGLGDFWGRRWNLGYSHMMSRTVLRPTERFLGTRGASMAVFLVSGLLHEVAITVPVNAGYGLPTLYFLLQGLAVECERFVRPTALKRVWAALWVIAPIGLLFPLAFRDEVIIRCLQMLPDFPALIHL
ncbi:MAG: MBOAT family protein [Roseibacillus sp.]|jgi:alginate O-acetyltransferase complex protein AlgI